MTYFKQLKKDRDLLRKTIFDAGFHFVNNPQALYACQFLYEAEKYDRMICRYNGIPKTYDEEYLCLDHAIKVKKIREQMIDAHIDVSGFNKLIAKIDYLWRTK